MYERISTKSYINEHGRSHYLLRPPRKRKYDRKLPEELLTERNDFFKKIMDQSKEMTKMSKELKNYEEAKEWFEQQTETLHELFERGLIDKDGRIVEN